MTATPELLVDAGASLGECPRWDAARERLWWVDIDAGRVHDLDPATGDQVSHELGRKVGAIAPRRGGGAVLATAAGFEAFDPATGTAAPLASVDMPAGVIMNDGACDPAGRFWAGTVAEDERPGAGSLYRLDAGGAVHAQLADVTISNGLGWSPDGTLMYYVDTATGGVDVFDFDVAAGALAGRRRFVDVPERAGYPDGLAVDDDGAVWVALWEGAAVNRYLPDGRLDRTVSLPTTHVTACAFAGPGRTTLFVTTAAGYLDPAARAEQPHAGALFAVDVGVGGPAAAAFAG